MPRVMTWLCNALRCVWSLSVQQIALSWEPVETIGSRWNLAGGNRKWLLKVKPAPGLGFLDQIPIASVVYRIPAPFTPCLTL